MQVSKKASEQVSKYVGKPLTERCSRKRRSCRRLSSRLIEPSSRAVPSRGSPLRFSATPTRSAGRCRYQYKHGYLQHKYTYV